MEIQELISRGRLLFEGAPKRLEVFKLVNGRRSSIDIALKTRRGLNNVLKDLQKMKDMGIVSPKVDNAGVMVKRERSTVFEKEPALRHIGRTYFEDAVRAKKKFGKQERKRRKKDKSSKLPALAVPTVAQILDICHGGEDQVYEFKRAGVETRRLTKEIGAFANTKMGGIIFYGIEDDGTVSGSDIHRQKLDQSLQNSVRSTISPSLTIKILEKNVLGQTVLLIVVPPWNKKDVYYYEGRTLIRKGGNVFVATPEECKKLHKGVYVV